MFTRYGRIGLALGFLLFALLLLYARAGAAATPTILEDDFNSYAAGPLTSQGGWSGDTFRVQETTVLEGAKAVEASGAGYRTIVKTGAGIADGKITVAMRKTSSTTGILAFKLLEDGADRARVSWPTSGNIVYFGPDDKYETLVAAAKSNTWYVFEIEWRGSDKRFRFVAREVLSVDPLSYDGVIIDTGFVAVESTFATKLNSVQLQAVGDYGAEKGFFDSIAAEPVPAAPPPSPTPTNTPVPTPTPTPTPTATPVQPTQTPTSGWQHISTPGGSASWTAVAMTSDYKGYGQVEKRFAVVSGMPYCVSLDAQGDLSWAYLVVSKESNDTGRVLLNDHLKTGLNQTCFTSPADQDYAYVLLGTGGGTWWTDTISLESLSEPKTTGESGELLRNGTFEYDTRSWNKLSTLDGFAMRESGRLKLGSSGVSGSYGQIEQRISVARGAEYCLSVNVEGDLAWAALAVSTDTGGKGTDQILLIDFRSAGAGRHERCFVAPENNIYVLLVSGGGTWYADNVSLRGPVPLFTDPLANTEPTESITLQIVSPSWGQVLAAKPDEAFRALIQVEKPSDVTVSFARRQDYPPGSEPAPPELTVNSSTGEVLWTPTSAHEGKTYAVTAEAAFSDADSRSDRVTFFVEVTNTSPAPVNNQVLGTIVGGDSSDTLTDEERWQIQQELSEIAATLGEIQLAVKQLEGQSTQCATYYTVQSGDMLSAIALHYYGNANKWPDIYAVNKGVIGSNPDFIFPGQMLCIPGEVTSTQPMLQGENATAPKLQASLEDYTILWGQTDALEQLFAPLGEDEQSFFLTESVSKWIDKETGAVCIRWDQQRDECKLWFSVAPHGGGAALGKITLKQFLSRVTAQEGKNFLQTVQTRLAELPSLVKAAPATAKQRFGEAAALARLMPKLNREAAAYLIQHPSDAAKLARIVDKHGTEVLQYIQQKGFDPTLRAKHFADHAARMGIQTELEYELLAKMFLNRPVGGTLLSKIRSNGDVVRFDTVTEHFGVKAPDGRIRTFYKPERGVGPDQHSYPTNLDYFLAQ